MTPLKILEERTTPQVSDPVLALLQQISQKQDALIQSQDELTSQMEDLSSRVGQLELRPAGEVAAPKEERFDKLTKNLLNEEGYGIPDDYFKNQSVVVVGRRTEAEVLEQREKLQDAVAREAANPMIWRGD